jgi:hypothetical protein
LRPGVQYLLGDESWPGAGEPGNGARGFVLRTGASQGGNWDFNFTMAHGPADWWTATGPQRRITDEWHHVASCKTLDDIRLFWDGKLYISRPIKGEKFIPCESNLFLGVRRNGWQDRQVDADYRAFRISRKALYQEAFAPPKNLFKTADTSVLLDFSVGKGKVIPDLSGQKHDGTVTGGEWLEEAGTKLEPETTEPVGELRQLKGPTQPVWCVAYAPDGPSPRTQLLQRQPQACLSG